MEAWRSKRDSSKVSYEIRSWTGDMKDCKRHGNNEPFPVLTRACCNLKCWHVDHLLPSAFALPGDILPFLFACKYPRGTNCQEVNWESSTAEEVSPNWNDPRNWINQMSVVGNWSNTRMSAVVFLLPTPLWVVIYFSSCIIHFIRLTFELKLFSQDMFQTSRSSNWMHYLLETNWIEIFCNGNTKQQIKCNSWLDFLPYFRTICGHTAQ